MNATVVAIACAVAWGAQEPAAGSITRLERGSAREVTLRAAAERWRSAVVARDVPGIVRSALPEERPLLERALRAPLSPAAQALLRDWIRDGDTWRMSYTDIPSPDEGDGVG
jgi:hypothetical protein